MTRPVPDPPSGVATNQPGPPAATGPRRGQSWSRRPGWIYGVSAVEPDYRYSLANERTFLAWIRTALALLAAGAAAAALDLGLATDLQKVLSAGLLGLSALVAALSWPRWARAERSIRAAEPLPSLGVGLVLATALTIVIILTLVVTL